MSALAAEMPSSDGELDAEYGKLIDTEFPRLIALCKVQGRSEQEAEDIVGEAFTRLYERRSQIRVPAAYLRRIVCNLLKRPSCERPEADVGDQQISELRDVAEFEGEELVQVALGQLPRAQRQVFALRLEGRSTREIAMALGIAPATARSHHRHACEKLQIWWAKEGEELR